LQVGQVVAHRNGIDTYGFRKVIYGGAGFPQ
jgi:hypothetical protein